MYRIIKKHGDEIKEYCLENDLSVDAVFSSATSEDDVSVFILGPGDPERGKLGLMDDVPLPIALEIYLEDDDTLRFEQTEFTRLHLGNEMLLEPAPVGEPAMA